MEAELLQWGVGALGTVLGLVALGLRLRVMGRSLERGDALSTDRWYAYAHERGWAFHPTANGAKMIGEVDGQPITVAVKITVRRGRHGREFRTAETSFRAPVRGRAPAGLLVRRRGLANQFRGLFDGGRPLDTGDADLDRALLISADEVGPAGVLVLRPPVRAALLALFEACPGAVVHERAVEFVTANMVSDPRYLDLYCGAITTATAALEGYLERLPFEGGFRTPAPAETRAPGPAGLADEDEPLPEDAGVTLIPDLYIPDVDGFDEDADAIPTEATAPVPIDLPVEEPPARPPPEVRLPSLYMALRSLGGGTVAQRTMRVQHLRLSPYRYEIEVRSVQEGMSRLGIKTGRLQVNGVLTQARWRVELMVEAEHADAALLLISGDIIRGECLIEDVRGVGQVVECLARGAPERVDQPRSGTGGGAPT